MKPVASGLAALPANVPVPGAPFALAPQVPPLVFRPLHESPVLAASGYCCRACRHGPGAEECAEDNEIVLMRRGAFTRHLGRRIVTVDVNQVAFFSKGATYRIGHPADGGDEGTVLRLSPDLLVDVVREFDPRVDDRPGEALPFLASPCGAATFLAQREIAWLARAGGPDARDPLQADGILLGIAVRVLATAFAFHLEPRRPRRSAVTADQADRAEVAKSYLAARVGERVRLHEVARAVHASPFHFARAFRRQAGMPVHRYLMQLRLRTALHRLAEGTDDLAALALGLGFCSHSHFTQAFRREFGRSPSDFRRRASSRLVDELGKILKAPPPGHG